MRTLHAFGVELVISDNFLAAGRSKDDLIVMFLSELFLADVAFLVLPPWEYQSIRIVFGGDAPIAVALSGLLPV